jgi:SagB-type dehydrogenase family enzyme
MKVVIPNPSYEGDISVETALLQRRSVWSYTSEPLMLSEVAQLLWAVQGINDPGGKRTAPSAGALYPLEVYLVAGNVTSLEAGVYWYKPQLHEMVRVLTGEKREVLSQAALNQSNIRQGAIDVVITAVYERTTQKYGERGIRYVYLEAGHAAQNLYLQAVSLDLGVVVVGAFYNVQVQKALNLPKNAEPLYIIPVGKKANN